MEEPGRFSPAETVLDVLVMEHQERISQFVVGRSFVLGASLHCILQFILLLYNSYSSNLYCVLYKTQSQKQSLGVLSEPSHLSVIGILCIAISSSAQKDLSGFFVLNQLFICSLFNVYRWLFPFCIHSLQSNSSSPEQSVRKKKKSMFSCLVKIRQAIFFSTSYFI